MEMNLRRWDWDLLVYLNNLSPDALDPFWTFVTQTEHWIPFYVFLVALFFFKLELKKAFLGLSFLLLSLGFAKLITELTKALIERPRPNVTTEIMGNLKVLHEPTNFSFFSGHASTSFATAVFVYLVLKSKYKYPGMIFIWPLLFSLSRIFVGVHFPSDIFVGALVGTFIAIICAQLYANSARRLLSVGNENNT